MNIGYLFVSKKTSAKTHKLKKQIPYPVNNVAMKLTHSISKHTVNSMYQAVCKLIWTLYWILEWRTVKYVL